VRETLAAGVGVRVLRWAEGQVVARSWGEGGLAAGSGGFGETEGCGDLTGDCNIRFGFKGFEKWIGSMTCFAGRVGRGGGRGSEGGGGGGGCESGGGGGGGGRWVVHLREV
jgi:hypothetical protein